MAFVASDVHEHTETDVGYIDLARFTVLSGSRHEATSVIYVIDSPEHPSDVAIYADGLKSWVVTVPVACWNAALTPWPAAALYREEPDFEGHAAETLEDLLAHVIPAAEAQIATETGLAPSERAICGYSLGGLFSLYAFTHCDAFTACGCLSGSVWYEGWVEHLQGMDGDLTGRYAYFSLGTKEKRGGQPLMRTVQKRMEECVELLRRRGCRVDYVLGPGNHLQHIPERYEAGLRALDAAL